MTEEEKMLEAVLGASEDVNEDEPKLQNTTQEDSDDNQEEGPRFKKEFNLKKQMPWLPSNYDMLCYEQRSAVDQAEQKRMIAMCQNLMNFGTFQHASNRRELKVTQKFVFKHALPSRTSVKLQVANTKPSFPQPSNTPRKNPAIRSTSSPEILSTRLLWRSNENIQTQPIISSKNQLSPLRFGLQKAWKASEVNNRRPFQNSRRFWRSLEVATLWRFRTSRKDVLLRETKNWKSREKCWRTTSSPKSF